jgi:hypothetical protein
MSAAVSDGKFAALVDPVYKTVFVVYMPRPPAGHVAAKLFGMANAVKWIAVDIFDELIEPFQDFFVLRLPVQVVLPGSVSPRFVHISALDECVGGKFTFVSFFDGLSENSHIDRVVKRVGFRRDSEGDATLAHGLPDENIKRGRHIQAKLAENEIGLFFQIIIDPDVYLRHFTPPDLARTFYSKSYTK